LIADLLSLEATNKFSREHFLVKYYDGLISFRLFIFFCSSKTNSKLIIKRSTTIIPKIFEEQKEEKFDKVKKLFRNEKNNFY
jgi:hypothetical protein